MNGMVCASRSDAKTIDKGHKVSREAPRLLPVERVPSTLIYHEPRVRDSPQKDILIVTGAEGIPPAPDKERGCFDLVQLAHKIILQEAFEGCSPHKCRDLQALLHDGVEEGWGYWLGQRALLKLAHEAWIDRIRQLGYTRLPEVDCHRVALVGSKRASKHEAQDALRVVDGEALSVGAAHRGTDDYGWPKSKGICESFHVYCEITRAITRRRAIRVAMAPLGQGKGMDGLGQVRQHRLEGAPRVGITV